MKLLPILSILFLLGCRSTTKIILEGKEYEAYAPPNTVQISENFFTDETEVSNIDYQEYLYWLQYIFGRESNRYLAALPDTLVFREYLSYGEPYVETYHTHPSFDMYPVVGVSLDQAKKYTDWRTERVVEMVLMQKGFIKDNPTRDSSSYFTIDRYFEGDFDWVIKREPTLILPKYKIPSVEEWEKIAGVDSGFRFGLDSLSKANKKWVKRGYSLFVTDDTSTVEKQNKYLTTRNTPFPVRYGLRNLHGLYGMIGNVAEMVDEENIVKGGSWKHKIKDIEITKNERIEKPNAWVGFRNVCQFYRVKQ